MVGQRNIVLGFVFGALAGALWGLVFLAPKLVPQFGAIQLTAGRYVAYGLIALVMLVPVWRLLKHKIRRKDWMALVVLALLGNTIYYLFLAKAVQMGGMAMTALVIGFLPVTVTIIGSRDKGALPLRQLALPLVFSVAGALVIGAETFLNPATDSLATSVLAFGCAVGALVSWTAFAVGNTRALNRLVDISSHEWSLLLGVVTGVQGVLLVPLALMLEPLAESVQAWGVFAAVCAAIGLLSSVVGNALWNRMSRLLPLTMVGQMILFETLFALLYAFAWDRRWPTPLEAVSMVLVVISVMTCLAAHETKNRRTKAAHC